MDWPVKVRTRTRLVTYTLVVTCLMLCSHRGKTDFLSMPIKHGSFDILASSVELFFSDAENFREMYIVYLISA